ncbi:EipB family protein [Dongia sp. agr-C8]
MDSAGLLGKATALGAAVFLLSADIAIAQDSSGANLVAHKATYVLSIAPDSNSGQVTSADGVMTFELKNACDGWATDLKFKFAMATESGENRDMEISQVAWESKDGLAYRYNIKNGAGGETLQQLRGEARLDSIGGKGSATSDLPSRAEADLPAGTMFPVAHTKLVLEKAAAGENVVSAEYFDGNASVDTMMASALIGAGEKDWPGLQKKFPELEGHVSYPIGLAFYSVQTSESEPDSEQVQRLYDNGVISNFSIELGALKLRAALSALELLPDPGC